MDKTKHPDWLIIATYGIMAFARAGKDLLTFPDMVISGIAGILLGYVIVKIEKLNQPVYICRGAGAFFAALLIIEICFRTGFVNSEVIDVIAAMIPPAAAGAMLIEGMCTFRNISGRKKVMNAVLVSIFLALGVFMALIITKIRGVSVI
ncbi:MAG: threonine/serine exporter family protein [Oscillospiraceae bacterium]|nr:threonine/serine exporter family protein [Oscillospiraceae bacterium]